MHRMATQKRRVIYLSDEEWAKVGERSSAFGLSRSAYIGKLIEWRQPGPAYIETGARGEEADGFPYTFHARTPDDDRAGFSGQPPTHFRAEFRPVPKPGKRK